MSRFTEIFGNNAQAKVLEFFLKNPDIVIYLSQIAQLLNISHSTVSRVIKPLVEKNIIIENKIGTRFRIFKLNKQEKLTKALLNFYLKLNQ